MTDLVEHIHQLGRVFSVQHAYDFHIVLARREGNECTQCPFWSQGAVHDVQQLVGIPTCLGRFISQAGNYLCCTSRDKGSGVSLIGCSMVPTPQRFVRKLPV